MAQPTDYLAGTCYLRLHPKGRSKEDEVLFCTERTLQWPSARKLTHLLSLFGNRQQTPRYAAGRDRFTGQPLGPPSDVSHLHWGKRDVSIRSLMGHQRDKTSKSDLYG
jgi:hypothetical protein